jgi:hypothetical protein
MYADFPVAPKVSNKTNMVPGECWNQFSSITGTESLILTGVSPLLTFASTVSNINVICFSATSTKETEDSPNPCNV